MLHAEQNLYKLYLSTQNKEVTFYLTRKSLESM